MFQKLSAHNKEMVMGFATLVENRDGNTGGHIRRTTTYVEILAKELKNRGLYKDELTEDYIKNLVMAAPMHDVGKIAIPDAILQKPGKLTAEEYAAIQGYILDGAQFFEPEIAPAKQEPTELLRRIVNVHIAPSPLCRAVYTEKALKAAVLTGTKQYVMLGAGMDTFAFREKEFLSKHRVFEVDHPLTQTDKRKRIRRTGWTVPDNLAFVPVDFTKDNLTECLITAGFDPSAKAFFSWLPYL